MTTFFHAAELRWCCLDNSWWWLNHLSCLHK